MAIRFNPFTGDFDLVGGTGSTGPQGPQGAAGPPGADGVDGEPGEPGPPGPTGSAGATGATGPQGAQGSQGPPGLDGADGEDGTQGPAGPAGAAGATGATGATGAMGPPGMDGSDGDDGATGPPGPQGPPGPTGSQGPTGPTGPPSSGDGDGDASFLDLIPPQGTFDNLYFFLPGRKGGQIAHGGINAGDNLDIFANYAAFTDANAGRVIFHHAATFSMPITISAGGALSVVESIATDTITGGGSIGILHLAPTINYNTPNITGAFVYQGGLTLVPSVSLADVVGDYFSFFDLSTFSAQTAITASAFGLTGYRTRTVVESLVPGSSATVTNVSGLRIDAQVSAATGSTAALTTYRHIWLLGAVAAGAGGTETIGTVYGVDMPSNFGGTTNVSLRSLDPTASMLHSGAIHTGDLLGNAGQLSISNGTVENSFLSNAAQLNNFTYTLPSALLLNGWLQATDGGPFSKALVWNTLGTAKAASAGGTALVVDPEAIEKTFTVTDANVTASSKIMAMVTDGADFVTCDTHARAGSFDITLHANNWESEGFLKGQYDVVYIIAA